MWIGCDNLRLAREERERTKKNSRLFHRVRAKKRASPIPRPSRRRRRLFLGPTCSRNQNADQPTIVIERLFALELLI